MVGLGYVGRRLWAAAELAMAGHDVNRWAWTLIKPVVDALSAGWVPLYEPGLKERLFALATEKGLLHGWGFLHRDEVAERDRLLFWTRCSAPSP